MPTAGKVHCFIAASIDGYIATNTGDLSFLSLVEQEGEDYGYGAFIKNIDAVIVGRTTYDKVLSMGVPFPHTDKPCYVITHKERPPIGQLQFYSGDLNALVQQLCVENGYQVFVDGGAAVLHQLFLNNLVDTLVISVIPILLGDGIPLFKPGRPSQQLQMIASKQYSSGLVQLHYARKEAP